MLIFLRATAQVSGAINELLNAEMNLYLGEPDQADNRRNGYKTRSYTLKGIGTVELRIPQARQSGFESSIIPKGERIDPRLKEDMAVLTLAGLSTRTLAMVSRRLLGIDVGKDTVSASLDLISDRACSWLDRPLEEEYWALYIDGTNFNIKRRYSVEKEPSLVVLGIGRDGYRSILSIQPGQKDSSECWRTIFKDLKNRGLNPKKVRIGIMDGLPGLEKVFKEEFTQAVTQRCWVHALKNALNKCPKRLRDAFKVLAEKVMYASSQSAARAAFQDLKETMGDDGRRATACLEKDLESLLAHYAFERSYWRSLRTTNPIERVNKEIKRRTKSMDSLGEKTLEVIVAFVALRLEFNWRRNKVNAEHYERLVNMKHNAVEKVVHELTDQ
jgi:putative transposase